MPQTEPSSLAEILSAVTNLAWPLLAGLVLVVYRDRIGRLFPDLENKQGNITLKVGSVEYSVQQVADANSSEVERLEERIDTLFDLVSTLPGGANAPAEDRDAGDEEEAGPAAPPNAEATGARPVPQAAPPSAAAPAPAGEPEPAERPPIGAQTVLWVDDKPNNNLYQITALQAANIGVETVASTDEAMKHLEGSKPTAIISDMGRWENGDWHGDAGLELIRKVRASDDRTPIFVYASSGYARNASARREVLKQGTGLTDSPRELFKLLEKHAGIHAGYR